MRNFNYILIIVSIFSFFFTNCSQDTQKKEENKKIPSVIKEVEKTENKVVQQKHETKKPNITNKNVKEFLTKYGKNNNETIVLLTTDFGNIKIKLYKETPLHRASFIRLIKIGFYDNTYFYRVVKGFVIQGGDSDYEDRKQKKKQAGRYSIPAEFNPNFFHKRGAIAMTRDYKNNPDKRSASFDFYIIQGEKYNNFQLDALENQYKIEIDEQKRIVYRSEGGAPHLDGEHTVFGEVINGFETIEKIANTKVDRSDWPVNDIYIKKVTILE